MSSLFVSYSRQDSPFADYLLDELEDRGFKVWMDYQSLTPAQPWADQIDRGIQEADVVLLVVSKASLESQYAGEEIARAFEFKKRVILVIFQAVELPPWLEQCEWVDFRKSYKRGLKELVRQLQSPLAMAAAPPRHGFAAPLVVWISFVLSLAVCAISFLSFWTLYIPYFLIPLPYRILKRDFYFFHVQLALVLLPLGIALSIGLDPGTNEEGLGAFGVYWAVSFFLSLLLVPLLLVLLRSKGMRRWGKPIASRPTFANVALPAIEKPRSVTFAVQVAPEDKRYGDDLIKGMVKYGHGFVAEEEQAEVAFVLISRYNTLTTLNPEVRVVYPVILQSVKGIDPKLERIQWIDFRRGLKNLDALAQLLPEPAKIFKALGIAPMGNQTVLPPVIQALVVYLTLLGIATIGSFAVAVFQLRGVIKLSDLQLEGLLLVLFFGSVFLTVRSLVTRKGRMASLRYLVPILIGVGFLLLHLIAEVSRLNPGPGLEPDIRGAITISSLLIYLAGLILIVPLSLWYWKDLRRWSPRKNKTKKQPKLKEAQPAGG